jgi:uncharacterized cysteine cluster protein YcgN (CxxCxxCC family)
VAKKQGKQPEFLQKPIEAMTESEWESLCDGCGLCCQIRIEDGTTGKMTLSNAACRLLCLESHQCTDYANRQTKVPDCVKITPQNVHSLDWLPYSCAYRLVAKGYDLPEWHYLLCGDKERVHREGISMRGETVSEDDVDWDEYGVM